MERSHEEIQGLLGAYALDAVDADEAAAVEAHLETCPRCAAEVSDHREVAAMMAYSGAPAPEGVWTKIVDSLEEPPPEMNLPRSAPADERSSTSVTDLSARRGLRQWLPLTAAAAALLVIGILAGTIVTGDGDGDARRPEVAQSIEDLARDALNDPTSTRVELQAPGDGTLTAPAAIEADGAGYLIGTSLPALDESQTYQLWGLRGGEAISLGVLGRRPGVVAFHVDGGIDALAVTAEVSPGVPQSVNPAVLFGSFA